MSAIPDAVDPLQPNGGAPLPTVHPTYASWAPTWRLLIDVLGGTGGFANGTNLVAHPREWKDYDKPEPSIPMPKLVARRRLARYDNFASTIFEHKHAALFRKAPTRTIGGSKDSTEKHQLALWWQNVDGKRMHIDDYMSQSFILAALFGHLLHVMDRKRTAVPPISKADEKPLYLRWYSPLDMPDWLFDDDGCLSAVKLLEVVQRASLDESPLPVNRYRQRYLTETDWVTKTEGGQRIDGDKHTFGRLPVVVHYAKRRPMSPLVGQSVLGDPKLYVDLYNLTSETRELFRNQVFGWLNVELGTGDQATDIEKAQKMIGTGAGTDNVLFSPGPANFIQPDAANIESYHKEREILLRGIYRQASIPWESDTRDAEAEGSLKLKREDMNQILAAYADECEKAEYEIVELWFRGTYGADRWQEEFEKADVSIRYPDEFDVTPFAEILEQAQAAIALEMPPTFMKESRRRIAREMLPDAAKDVLEAIDKELEAQAKENPEDVLTKATTLFQKIAAKAQPDDEGGQVSA